MIKIIVTQTEIDDLKKRFTTHPVSEEDRVVMENLREDCYNLAITACQVVPVSRERALALTALEEFTFWINAGIARNG